MREKRFKSWVCVKFARITPACAGETVKKRKMTKFIKDHTRVCGKNTIIGQSAAETSGSPPRVREKRDTQISVNNRRRITPACAGKTVQSGLS